MLALLAITVAIAAFVQGSSGLGFALIVAPVAGIVAPSLLPVFLLAVMIPLNFFVMWRERSELDLRGASWITAARLVATPCGLVLLVGIPDHQLGLLVGAATVLAVVVSILAPSFTPRRGAYLGAGAVTGIIETATGVGGPPLALVYQHRPPAELRSTVAACFLIGEIASLGLLMSVGQAEPEQLWPLLPVLPALAVGAWLSRLTHHRIDATRMRFFVLTFALVSGGALMLGL
ncbi:MAG: TSUP family transporter [Haloechinothrix sp.]